MANAVNQANYNGWLTLLQQMVNSGGPVPRPPASAAALTEVFADYQAYLDYKAASTATAAAAPVAAPAAGAAPTYQVGAPDAEGQVIFADFEPYRKGMRCSAVTTLPLLGDPDSIPYLTVLQNCEAAQIALNSQQVGAMATVYAQVYTLQPKPGTQILGLYGPAITNSLAVPTSLNTVKAIVDHYLAIFQGPQNAGSPGFSPSP